MDTRKRGYPEVGSYNSNGGFKRSKQEMESYSTGLGIKSTPCTKFFSTSGCRFGDNCHYLHNVPGGYNAVAQMIKLGLLVPQGGASRGNPRAGPASSFGASATTKISVAASLTGAIIGKGGIHCKQICRETGVNLWIKDHERVPNLKNIELEGTFEQINEASWMVRELIERCTYGPAAAAAANARRPQEFGGTEWKPYPGMNYKTKLCERFAQGRCPHGEGCHFAHGEAELRR